MMIKKRFALALALLASPAGAEVVAASANGFEVRQTIEVAVPPAAAFAKFQEVGSWWSGEHTYSGQASNLSLTLSPGGCWCERTPGGGIQHMQLVYVDRGKRLVLTGSLGPLLYLATSGVMDVQFKPTSKGSQITVDYRAAGFFNGGADKIAPVVDSVLAEQVKRLGASLAR